jgi:hypothetical protein
MDGRPDDVTQILLAEYAALCAEAERRTTIQWNVVALQLASAGAITSLAIAAAANVALQWEGWRDQELAPDVARQRWFTATGWNALHPTRLAFHGVALLALVGALGAGIFLWISRSPSWYMIAGFALGWLIDALATGFLHRAFESAG